MMEIAFKSTLEERLLKMEAQREEDRKIFRESDRLMEEAEDRAAGTAVIIEEEWDAS